MYEDKFYKLTEESFEFRAGLLSFTEEPQTKSGA